jgi:hypothetical protein
MGEAVRRLRGNAGSASVPSGQALLASDGGQAGRLSGYASDAVVAASEAAIQADAKASSLSYLLRQRAEEALDVPPPEREVRTIIESLHIAHEAGRAADDALINVIRYELRSKPEAVLQPLTVLPAVRRRFWLRR